jgi:hypothetical protein
VNTGWVIGVNSAHVVTTNELDGASSGPSSTSTVAKIPGLLEDVAWWESSAISNSIPDKMSNEIFLDGSCWKLLSLLLDFWSLFNLHRSLLNLDLFSGFEIGDSLDLSSSIG